MEQLLGDTKRLVQRLGSHDNSVDILTSEAASLQNRLVAMRQYREEINKLNDVANHRPRSTLILGSQLENQRIQNLEQENRELTVSLAEHQSAIDLIMNKYREQVLLMMEPNILELDINKNKDQTKEIIAMKERIAEMARVMCESAAIDDSAQFREVEFMRKLQVENENLRELLKISGRKLHQETLQKIDYHYADTDCVSSKHKFLESKSSFSSPLQSYILGVNSLNTDKMIQKKDTKSIVGSIEEMNGNTNDILATIPLGKIEKRYDGSKNSNFLTPLPFSDDEVKTNSSSSNTSSHDHIKKLEQLFMDPNSFSDKDSNSHHPLLSVMDSDSKGDPRNYFSTIDPSENCFHAIITDIKPLDLNIDMNEKLFKKDNISNSPADPIEAKECELLSDSFESSFSYSSVLSQDNVDNSHATNNSIDEDENYCYPPMNDNEITTGNISLSGVPGVATDMSDILDSLTNNEVKDPFDYRLNIHNPANSELDVLNVFDDVLDFEMGDTDDDNTDESARSNNGDQTAIHISNADLTEDYSERFNISVHNTVTDNVDLTFTDNRNIETVNCNSSVFSSDPGFLDSDKIEHDSLISEGAISKTTYDVSPDLVRFDVNVGSTLTIEYDFNNICNNNRDSDVTDRDEKKIVSQDFKENIDEELSKETALEFSLPNQKKNGCFNGATSDNDSELTFTEEDINDALSGFDIFFDPDNDDDDNDHDGTNL